MQYFKLQLGCLVALCYLISVYVRENRRYTISGIARIFRVLLAVGTFSVLLDGCTAYTVNHLDTVSPILNTGFICSF